jgi:hydroxypyruvate reductase
MNARQDAVAIFEAAVAGVDPASMIEEALSLVEDGAGARLVVSAGPETASYDLGLFDRVFATGMGKASARMARGLEAVLGERLSGGLVAIKGGYREELAKISLLEAGHPLPDERSEAAARALLSLGPSLGAELGPRDLVIVLISGGGSSLVCAPAPGLSLADKTATTGLLLASGAAIHEVNCVRKHLSAIKGGRLAAALAPAIVLALVLSDVVGDELDAIASGPTVPDPTTFADALEILARYRLLGRLPPAVLAHLTAGRAGRALESPKPGDPLLASSRTLLVGTNRLALEAARAEAEGRGYRSLVLSSRITGEAREAALVFLGIGKDMAASGLPLGRPACLIAGGETTVTVRGGGRGGRNQEMALAFLAALGRSPRDGEDLVFLSAGTDGNDGPTDAAGALVDLGLYRRARSAGLDPAVFLANNDSYSFFEAAGGHVKTGPTKTNVCDIQLLLLP